MRRTNFHLFHISFLNDLLAGLEHQGVNSQLIIEKSAISKFNLKSQHTFLPQTVLYEFFENVKKSQKADIAGDFYGNFRLENLSDFGKYLAKSPDLYTVLEDGIKYNYQVQTNGKLKLEVKGPLCYFSMNHLDKPSKGRAISEKIEMSMMIKAFQHVLGFTWTPLEIQLTSSNADWLAGHLHTLDFSIKTNCKKMMIIFPTDQLATKNPYYSELNVIQDKDFNSNIVLMNKTIESLNSGHIPTVDELASYFNCSKRSIFREFNKSGQTYFSLLKSHLFSKSLEMLKDTSLCVHEISDRLGYDNTSNFIRAFKNWTGTTPYQYRKLNFA